VAPGANITYSISFRNNGPSAAGGPTVDDTLPANTTFVSMTPPAGWTVTTPAVGGTGAVQAFKGSVANGETATFTLVVHVDPGTPGGTVISNTATANVGTTADPTPGNNSQTTTTTVEVADTADLSIEKMASPNPVASGQLLTYTWTVTNNGPSDATNVQLDDLLPPGLTFSSFGLFSGWDTCILVFGPPMTLDCQVALLSAGGTTVVSHTFTVDAANGSILTNTATTTATTADPDATNNSETETTFVGEAGSIVVELDTDPEQHPALRRRDAGR
jgi:uncharacterized repeat protein (TIGR01451 family)